MLPPHGDRPRRYCYCPTCGEKMGRLRKVANGGALLLYPTNMVSSAHKTGKREWRLTCTQLHQSLWTGDGIHWDDVPRAA